MKTQLIFENGIARLVITPEGEYEQRMLGALVGNTDTYKLTADCTVQHKNSYSRDPAEVLSVHIRRVARNAEAA